MLGKDRGIASIQDQVIADLEERKKLGLRKYGTLLQPNNGRDALRDAYEEVLDLCCYLAQVLTERSSLSEDIAIAELVHKRLAEDNGNRTTLPEVAASFGIDLNSEEDPLDG